MNDQEFQEKLAELRKEIDAIDSELLPLFLKRMDCSVRVAKLKQSVGAPVFHPGREQQILDRVREQGGKYGEEAAALYRAIMSASRQRQHQLLADGGALRELEKNSSRTMPQHPNGIVCQGVEGAYSHHAALQLFPHEPITFEPTWNQVFEDVQSGKAQLGVLPVENSAAGSVNGVYDLILQYRFYIVGATAVKVEHCLAAWNVNEPITTVVSHPQALSQCSEYIESHQLKAEEYSNTAAAAKYVSEEHPAGTAVLCAKDAAEQYGLTVLQEAVQNEKNNQTRFIVISKEPILPENANKISLCFSLPHTPGALHTILDRFAMRGLNMTKIESRPIPGSAFEYDFYLDFTGNLHKKETLELICALQDELPRFSFLGNYSEE